ncbi:putative bifunctional diguanylate cyclase/phosphodiesterase [Methylorubrum aminovorans]|uniref:putative bifunctional diguanylate cyclase/phosphodiesterase n=1 Tax=Methylorubrum aminovorans TaxID=269069 RepID=UPI003C2E316A
MPSYDDVVLGRLGRLGDRCALITTRDGRAERILWGGAGFRDWFEDEIHDRPLSGTPDEIRRPVEEIAVRALRSGEPASARCDRITDGIVTTWSLLGVPLAKGGGMPLLLIHVDEEGVRTELVQAMFGATGQGLMAVGAIRDAEGSVVDFKIVAANQGTAEIFRRPAASLQWQRLGDLVPPRLGVTGLLSGILGRTERAVFETAFPRADGTMLHLKVEARAIGDLIAVAMTDIGDIKAREASFRFLFENNPLPMWLVDGETARFVAVNEAAVSHYGYSREAFLARGLSDLSESGLSGFARDGGLHRHLRADGSLIEVTLFERSLAFEGRPAVLGAAIDVTEQRRAEARITHMAHHDALTGLPNRVLFSACLIEAIAEHARTGAKAALLCLDLDKFKFVNDTLGHPAGDALLRQVAERITACLRREDLVARLGGDEFAVLLRNPDAGAVETITGRIIEALARPVRLGDRDCQIGVSIGIARLPEHGTESDTLLRNADLALYRAKAEGGSLAHCFEAAMDSWARSRRRRETDLHEAFARGDLALAYQPVVDVRARTIVGFEALLRWHHPAEGMVPPAEFVPLAEETGLIVPIGAWVLRQACAEASLWADPVRVAVNLSPVQFRDPGLVATVREALALSGLAPQRLELEVTESVLLAASEANVATLHALRDLGVRIAMDDFGTGYCSLSYLQKFPFDKIKIDRSFVSRLGEDPHSTAIVRAVIGLGASLGIVTVAEGVETEAQFAHLREEGCGEVQGYLFGRPSPATAARALMQREPDLAA